ncbi:hypothetical protein AGLY_004036 [Aphis glycines]|uniref:Uncharacterized protein n=1 Tax=Aphis glycines TaxID=307491 RepID=A0A6G0TXU3_APHGL|nr:hypothetical protein AGLY_004036 [Aphis glycines]
MKAYICFFKTVVIIYRSFNRHFVDSSMLKSRIFRIMRVYINFFKNGLFNVNFIFRFTFNNWCLNLNWNLIIGKIFWFIKRVVKMFNTVIWSINKNSIIALTFLGRTFKSSSTLSLTSSASHFTIDECLTSGVLLVFIEVLLMPLFGAKLFDNNDEEGLFSSNLTKLELPVVSIELSSSGSSKPNVAAAVATTIIIAVVAGTTAIDDAFDV